MTKLAVSVMVQSLEQALEAATLAAARGADLVEFRMDLFTEHPQQAVDLLNRSPLPCILTVRPTWEGGQYDGQEQSRISFIEHVCLNATHPPAYLDIELAAYQTSANLRQKVGLVIDHAGQVRPTNTGLILSSHDFETRPIDLFQRIEAMASAAACRVMKLAWRARSLRDNVEALEIVSQRHKPTIALCMGEFGLPSRVLAKKAGALLTFAALDAGSATAPGQPTVEQLKTLYRWDALTAASRVYGVIGYPVGHSMSPAIHNAGFDAIGYDGVYLPLPIPPEYEHLKATLIQWLDSEAMSFRGASVTIPHKENLLRFVAEQSGEIEPLAQRIGAANTLAVRDDGSLYACNTDYAAALDAVCDAMSISRDQLAGRRVAVLGAGGAARAIVAGYAQHGATVVIYNRTAEKAQALATEFADLPGKIVSAPLENLCKSCCEIYINCTPQGMSPNVDSSPLPSGADGSLNMQDFGSGTVVFDTVYNPVQTKLLKQARAAGCLTVPGPEMFVRQAAAQFQLWTAQPAPMQTFRAALAQRLGS
jgi:3-dehydroquinate dehydratase/shikimate dehydrogenase